MAKIDTDKLKDMIYGMVIGDEFVLSKMVSPENREAFIDEIKIFIDNDYWIKHGFTLKLSDDRFTKVAHEQLPEFTLAEVKVWNSEFYSETRINLRKTNKL